MDKEKTLPVVRFGAVFAPAGDFERKLYNAYYGNNQKAIEQVKLETTEARKSSLPESYRDEELERFNRVYTSHQVAWAKEVLGIDLSGRDYISPRCLSVPYNSHPVYFEGEESREASAIYLSRDIVIDSQKRRPLGFQKGTVGHETTPFEIKKNLYRGYFTSDFTEITKLCSLMSPKTIKQILYKRPRNLTGLDGGPLPNEGVNILEMSVIRLQYGLRDTLRGVGDEELAGKIIDLGEKVGDIMRGSRRELKIAELLQFAA